MTKAGYIGKVTYDSGSFYAPYVPYPFTGVRELKIISGPVVLAEGQTAYQLSTWPDNKTRTEIRKWAIDSGIAEYVLIKPYIEVTSFGDEYDVPSLQISKDAPESVHTLTMLRWA